MNTEVQSGMVDVDGASIYYERRGTGPALLLIPGGGGDAGYYADIADLLADQYTVLTYDIRGNSRSRLTAAPAPLRMEQQSADAVAVIAHNGFRSALVFGNSSGATIGIDLATRHPDAVAGLIAHEPPLISVLPDAATYAAFFDEVERVRDREGVFPAYALFIAHVILANPPAIVRARVVRWLGAAALRTALRVSSARQRKAAGATSPDARRRDTILRIMKNTSIFVTHEMRSIIDYVPDLEALRAGAAPIVMAGGQDSRAFFYCRTGEIIAKRLGAPFVEFPGAHTGYLDDPPRFAVKLRETLARLAATPRPSAL